jgi:predicted metal-dependent TIM-barrel fold hydrolase
MDKKLTIHHYVDVIEAVGPEGVILSSDLGQTFTLPMAEGLKTFFSLLTEAGVHADDIARMSILNPRKLLFGEMG